MKYMIVFDTDNKEKMLESVALIKNIVDVTYIRLIPEEVLQDTLLNFENLLSYGGFEKVQELSNSDGNKMVTFENDSLHVVVQKK